MALRDPVAAYNAANNVEAHLIANLLMNGGVEAHVTEDVSQVGTWMFGLIPELHKPQVWIERADAERAKGLLEEYELREAERRHASEEAPMYETIETLCEECGQATAFPMPLRGSVQQCPHCRAYIDVEDDDEVGDWEEEGDESGAEP